MFGSASAWGTWNLVSAVAFLSPCAACSPPSPLGGDGKVGWASPPSRHQEESPWEPPPYLPGGGCPQSAPPHLPATQLRRLVNNL